MKAKYIKTKNKEIIIFSELQLHSEFSMFEPVSAGFIKIDTSNNNEPSCCYGESISLNLKSNSEEDARLARMQIFDLNDVRY